MTKWKYARLACFACALVVLAATATTAQERGPRGGDRGGFRGGPFGGVPGRGMDKLMLLRAEPVIEELGIDGAQQEKIRAAADESRQKGRDLFTKLRDAGDDDERGELRGKFEALAAETNQKVTAVLTDEQNQRLGEILIQLRGPHSLHDDAVAEKLALSAEQRQNIADLVDAEQAEQHERFSALRELPRDQMREKMQELRGEADAAHKATGEMLLAELSDAQAAQFKALGGKPFEVDREELFRSQFGGRGGPDGERRGGGPGGGRDRDRGEGRPNRPNSE